MRPALTSLALVATVIFSSPVQASGLSGANLSKDNHAFLTYLGEIEGKFAASVELASAGHTEDALELVNYKRDDLYAGFNMALMYRKLDGPVDEFDAMAYAIEMADSPQIIQLAWDEVQSVTDRLRADLETTPEMQFATASQLLREAGDYYAEAVQDGQVVDTTAFHKSWGNTEVALRFLTSLSESTDPTVRSRAAIALEYTAELSVLWPALNVAQTSGEAVALHGAAGWVDIAALQ